MPLSFFTQYPTYFKQDQNSNNFLSVCIFPGTSLLNAWCITAEGMKLLKIIGKT